MEKGKGSDHTSGHKDEVRTKKRAKPKKKRVSWETRLILSLKTRGKKGVQCRALQKVNTRRQRWIGRTAPGNAGGKTANGEDGSVGTWR